VNEAGFGAVVSGHPEASEAARKILISGGNAADAATTCLLMLCVTIPGATCAGGEAPLMIYDARTQKVDVLCGLGAAPGSAKAARRYRLGTDWQKQGADWHKRGADWFKRGTHWYRRGIYDAATPAMVHLCASLLMHYGTFSFERAVEPVLKWLAENKPTKYRDSVHKITINAVTGKPADKASRDKGDSGPFWWQDLLNTFERLVQAEKQQPGDRQSKLDAVIREFYEGAIAEEIAKWYEISHALLTYEDLVRHTTKIESPVSVQYGGLEVLKCDMWTQGPMVSQALKILDGFETRNQNCNPDERTHLVVETLKLAIADRFRHFGDPDFNNVSVDDLLADEYISLRRELIDSHKAQSHGPGDPLSARAYATHSEDGKPSSIGTTTCTVADKSGNVVAVTPSGCGSLVGAAGNTGIIHGTRLSQFVHQSGHPNSIETLKRPCITPSPTMVLKDGKLLIAASTAWGDYQDQIVVNLLVELVSHAERFDDTISSQQIAYPGLLMMPYHKFRQGEIMIPKARPDSARYLARLGHDVTSKNWQYKWSVIYFDPSSRKPRTWDGKKTTQL
jgi:gamma-glutamyltranspeptidase/glutathione hydrolase